MSELHRDHPGPWTMAEFLALGPTSERIELIDGRLRVTRASSRPHQDIARRTCNAIDDAAEAVGLRVYDAINVILGLRMLVIPDLVVGTMDYVGSETDATEVVLVGEVLSSPTRRTTASTSFATMPRPASPGTSWSSPT